MPVVSGVILAPYTFVKPKIRAKLENVATILSPIWILILTFISINTGQLVYKKPRLLHCIALP